MAKLAGIYRCEICGNIVEVLHEGAGELVCCGQPMKLCEENTVDALKEKHVPVIKFVEGGIKVTVGSVPHPMTDDHDIEWIELDVDGMIQRRMLKPGGKASAFFSVTESSEVSARAYCNLHGLWKADG